MIDSNLILENFKNEPTLTKEEYSTHMRPVQSNQVVRLRKEHFEMIEVIRVINSNPFGTPSTSAIVGVVLKKMVEDLEKLNPEKMAVVKSAMKFQD